MATDSTATLEERRSAQPPAGRRSRRIPLWALMDRYFTGEMVPPVVFGVFAFVVIILGDTLYTYVRVILERRVAAVDVLAFLIFRLPEIAVLALPVSAALACCMATMRLKRDGEIDAVRTSGVNLGRILFPVLLFSLALAALTFVIDEIVVPRTNAISENVLRKILLKQPTLLPRPGVFMRTSKNFHFYAERVDRRHNRLENLIVYQLRPDGLPIVFIAKSAVYRENIWELEDCITLKMDRSGSLIKSQASTARIDLKEVLRAYWSEQPQPEGMSIRELRERIKMFGKTGIPPRKEVLDLQGKIATPLACLGFALVGFGICLGLRSAAGYTGVLVAIALVFVYYVLMLWCRTLALSGVLPVVPAAWVPDGFFLILGVAFVWHRW